MDSHEAIREAVQGRTAEHAKTLNLSTSLVSKWQEPCVGNGNSGAYNPLDRTCAIVETALRLGMPLEKALSPVYYLNHRFNLVCFRMPLPEKGGVANNELVRTIKEFADLAQSTAESLMDGRISEIEAKKIVQEGEEAMRSIGTLLQVVKESVK